MTRVRLLEWRLWSDVAIEAVLRLGGSFRPAAKSVWPLPRDLRNRVIVRWPRTYQWHHASKWGDQVLDILRRRVRVIISDLPQPYRGTVQAGFEIDGKRHRVAFNTSDYPDFLDEQCTRESLVTFKFQFLENGYGQPNVIPGGYLPTSTQLYSLLPYLRWLKDCRGSPFEVYGRFSMDFSPEIRGEALRRLAATRAFRFEGGEHRVRYSRYLQEVARSQICVDLPGRGPLCFRLVEYLAIGACVVAAPHRVRFVRPLIDGVHISYCQADLDDLVSRCRGLLDDSGRRHQMEQAAREFFDRYLHRDQLSAYYLASVLAAAGTS